MRKTVFYGRCMAQSYGTLPELISSVFDAVAGMTITEDYIVELLDRHGENSVVKAVLVAASRCDVSAGDMRLIMEVWLDGISSPDAARKQQREKKRAQRAGK